MGRLSKIKQELIEEANKRLLGEGTFKFKDESQQKQWTSCVEASAPGETDSRSRPIWGNSTFVYAFTDYGSNASESIKNLKTKILSGCWPYDFRWSKLTGDNEEIITGTKGEEIVACLDALNFDYCVDGGKGSCFGTEM